MGKIVKKIGEFFEKVFEVVFNFIGDIFEFLISPFGMPDMPDTNAQADQSAQGVTLTKQGTNQAIPVVYGYRRVGGILVHAETGSDSNKYLWCVFALSEGEIEGIKRIIVEDVPLPLPSEYGSFANGGFYADGVRYDVPKDRFKGRILFQCYHGGANNTATPSVMSDAPIWPSKNRTMSGVAYVAMRFEWKEIKTQEDANNNPFNGGLPKVQFDICGKKVYNVRGVPVVGALNLPNDYADLPKNYNTNPANCILDYMMNPRYGAGIPKEKINAHSFYIAATKYDQTVTYNNNYSGKALTTNTVLDSGQKILDNLKTLAAGARGIMPYVAGRYKLKVEDGGNDTDITSTTINVAYDVDKNVIIGGITLQGEKKRTKLNQAVVNYIDPDLDFTNQQVIYEETGDLAIDENEKLIKEFTFHTITNKAMAWENARMIYKKSRLQKQISFRATQELLAVEVGDVIRVTDTVLQLTNATYRIVSMNLNEDLTVNIDAVEHDATFYPATGGVGQLEVPPPVYNPDELNVRPRQKDINDPPLGIVPPNGDPDSSGQSQELNPYPPRNEQPLISVTTFQSYPNVSPINTAITTKDGLGVQGYHHQQFGNYHLYPSATKGLLYHNPLATSTGLVFSSAQTGTVNGLTYTLNKGIQNDYIMFRNSQQLAGGFTGDAFVILFLNLPTNTAYNSALIRRFVNAELVDVNDNAIEGAIQPLVISTNNPKGGLNVNYMQFNWGKQLADRKEYHLDGSVLGSYTYYNPILGQNITGSNIEAYINYLIQNPLGNIAGVTPQGAAPAGGDSKTKEHDLGA